MHYAVHYNMFARGSIKTQLGVFDYYNNERKSTMLPTTKEYEDIVQFIRWSELTIITVTRLYDGWEKVIDFTVLAQITSN